MNRFIHGMVRAAVEAFDLPGPILEVGSFQVEGQEEIAELRGLFPGKEYTGIDLRSGPGVDRLADVEDLPFPDRSAGTVLALNTFEHVRRFWRGFEEIKRVLRPDGVLVVSVPFYFHIHAYPSDYWRFTPAAMDVLLEEYPTRVLGWHGPQRKPLGVWAVAFGKDATPPDAERLAAYRGALARYAFEPMRWSRWLRYTMGRWLCGSRPFAPFLEQDRWAIEVRSSRRAKRKQRHDTHERLLAVRVRY